MNIKTGYKQTEIGVIPEDWEVTNLGSVCNESMQNGVFFKPSNKGFGIKIINVGDLYKTSPIDIDSLELFNASNSEKERFRVKDGDLFFTRSSVVPSGIAHCNMYQSNQDESVVFDSHVIRVRLNKRKIISSFLFRFCISATARNYLISHAKTGTMTTIDQNVLAKCPVYLPSIKEQTAIATALSDIDALIGELDKLIAKKQGIKQATMQQLLTGKKRLAGFSGEWEENKLEKFASFYKGKGLAKNEIDIYGKTPCVHYGELFTQYAESITETHSRTNLSGNVFLSKNNDVLMPTSDVTPNGLAKASCILKDDIILGGDILVIRTNPKEINGTFLSFVIRHSKEKIMQLVTGSTVYHLYASDMKNFIFLIPSIEEQTAIATILSDMDAEINALQQKRDKTAQLKQGMMQELLTGRIRLIIVND